MELEKQDPETDAIATLCLISRGYGPIEPGHRARDAATDYGWHFFLISGKKLVVAKNKAAYYSLRNQTDLIMVEDDIEVDETIWKALQVRQDQPNTIHIAETATKRGSSNVITSPSGRFLFSGHALIRIPIGILRRMSAPIFRSWNFVYSTDKETLIDKGEADHGNHSDAYFWHCATQLDPPPEIEVIGEVKHIRHQHNAGRTNHADPYTPTYYERRDVAKI